MSGIFLFSNDRTNLLTILKRGKLFHRINFFKNQDIKMF